MTDGGRVSIALGEFYKCLLFCPKPVGIVHALLSIRYAEEHVCPSNGYLRVPEAVLICFCKYITTRTEDTFGVDTFVVVHCHPSKSQYLSGFSRGGTGDLRGYSEAIHLYSSYVPQIYRDGSNLCHFSQFTQCASLFTFFFLFFFFSIFLSFPILLLWLSRRWVEQTAQKLPVVHPCYDTSYITGRVTKVWKLLELPNMSIPVYIFRHWKMTKIGKIGSGRRVCVQKVGAFDLVPVRKWSKQDQAEGEVELQCHTKGLHPTDVSGAGTVLRSYVHCLTAKGLGSSCLNHSWMIPEKRSRCG